MLRYRDMSRGEMGRMVPNIMIMILMGIYPNYMTEKMSLTISGYII